MLSCAQVREKVGPTGKVIGAVSGGVDSSVAAVLLNRAIGDRFHAVMVRQVFLGFKGVWRWGEEGG